MLETSPRPFCNGLEERKLYGIIGYRRKGYFYKCEYTYDELSDRYICPAREYWFYKTTSQEGYRHYHSPQPFMQ